MHSGETKTQPERVKRGNASCEGDGLHGHFRAQLGQLCLLVVFLHRLGLVFVYCGLSARFDTRKKKEEDAYDPKSRQLVTGPAGC